MCAMSVFFLFIAVILIFITLAIYRKIYSALLAVIFHFSLTSLILIYGLNKYNTQNEWLLFGDPVPLKIFMHFITVCYIANLLCSIVIIKNYREYRRINSKKS